MKKTLKTKQVIELFYKTGPWAHDKEYSEKMLSEMIDSELKDFLNWIQPTENEKKIRLLTIRRYVNLVEHLFPNSLCVVQGSSATQTCLPTSDIDLIITNLSNVNEVSALRIITKTCWRCKLISNGFVIPSAKVPIAKLTDRPYGFSIDICIGNINGILNVKRVLSYMNHYPYMKAILMFLKVFVLLNGIDDPSKGGFGSNQLINIVLFAIQSDPKAKNLGELLLHILQVFAEKLNPYLVGISTVNGGCLFSKISTSLLDHICPNALIIEDPQFHNNFIGGRTNQTPLFCQACKSALNTLETSDYNDISPLFSILPNISDIIDRRKELNQRATILSRSPSEFSMMIDQVFQAPNHQKPALNDKKLKFEKNEEVKHQHKRTHKRPEHERYRDRQVIF